MTCRAIWSNESGATTLNNGHHCCPGHVCCFRTRTLGQHLHLVTDAVITMPDSLHFQLLWLYHTQPVLNGRQKSKHLHAGGLSQESNTQDVFQSISPVLPAPIVSWSVAPNLAFYSLHGPGATTVTFFSVQCGEDLQGFHIHVLHNSASIAAVPCCSELCTPSIL